MLTEQILDTAYNFHPMTDRIAHAQVQPLIGAVEIAVRQQKRGEKVGVVG